jgi:hypothetical protein
MAYKYRTGQRDFFLLGPQNEVAETQYGLGTGQVFFPNVSTCTVICLHLSDNSLLGCHLSIKDSADTVEAIFAKMNDERGARTITTLFLVGVLHQRPGTRDDVGSYWVDERRYAWPGKIGTINQIFGRPAPTPVPGFRQDIGDDRHYLVRMAGTTPLWFTKPQATALGAGQWQALTLRPL